MKSLFSTATLLLWAATSMAQSPKQSPVPEQLQNLQAAHQQLILQKRGLRVFAVTAESDALTEVFHLQWPENTVEVYNAFYDAEGTPIALLWSPVSESGDWSHTVTYYFLKDGSTYFSQHYTSYFSGLCDDQVVKETLERYYDAQHTLLHQQQSLTDLQDNPLPEATCPNPYTFQAPSIRHLHTWISAQGYEGILK